MQSLCKDVIAQRVSAIRDFQVRHLRQLPCSTLPLLASHYVSGQFHLIPVHGAAGGISVASCSHKSFCDTLRKCCLSPRAGLGPHSMSRGAREGSHPAVVGPRTSLPLPLAPPSSAIRRCGWTGAEMLMATAKAGISPEPSLLPTGTFQSRVPSTGAEVRCTMPLFKPPGLLVIE